MIKSWKYTNDIEFRRSDPIIETHRNVIYMPVRDRVAWEHDPTWGLYDEDQNLIEAGAYFRGPGKNLIGQSAKISGLTGKVEDTSDYTYVYGGNMIAHYGHFLISTLSRFWDVMHADRSKIRIVCHGAGTPDGWFSHRYMREIFTSLGLSKEQFVVFKRPTKLKRLVIPRPAAEEHNFVHAGYAAFGNRLGRSLLQNINLVKTDKPVWISKTDIRHGVQGLTNEVELDNRLEKLGFEIVHPQNLAIADQVMLFATRRVIAGTASSAFHSSILWEPGCRMVCLIFGDTVNSNFAIADHANRNQVEYIKADVTMLQEQGGPERRFMATYRANNVDDIVGRIMQAVGRAP